MYIFSVKININTDCSLHYFYYYCCWLKRHVSMCYLYYILFEYVGILFKRSIHSFTTIAKKRHRYTVCVSVTSQFHFLGVSFDIPLGPAQREVKTIRAAIITCSSRGIDPWARYIQREVHALTSISFVVFLYLPDAFGDIIRFQIFFIK